MRIWSWIDGNVDFFFRFRSKPWFTEAATIFRKVFQWNGADDLLWERRRFESINIGSEWRPLEDDYTLQWRTGKWPKLPTSYYKFRTPYKILLLDANGWWVNQIYFVAQSLFRKIPHHPQSKLLIKWGKGITCFPIKQQACRPKEGNWRMVTPR